jgi:hypothetical protein
VTITNHVVTGALVAVAINRPWLSLPAALLSHFAVDIIPHWDYKLPGSPRIRQAAILIDLTLALYLLLVLALSVDASRRLLIAGGFLGILPDIMWLPHILYGRFSPNDRPTLLHLLRRFHVKIQWNETAWGKYVEIAWLVAMLILIFRL